MPHSPASPHRLALKTGVAILAGLAPALLAAPASAGGFSLQEYSPRELGWANAGNAASVADAATVFANPAGLVALDRPQVTGGAHYIIGRAEFTDTGSTDVTGAPMAGTGADDLFEDALIPNAYGAMPIGDGRIWVGLGLTAPFGLSTDYPEDWTGRYQALRSDLKTVDINPSIGVQLTDWLAVGAGVSAQYADVTLSNAVDFGAVCLGEIEPAAPGSCASLGALPQQADGEVTLEGDSWAWGWNVGALMTFGDRTRLGLAYRSAIDHELEGDAQFEVPAALAPVLAPAFTDGPVSAPLDLPARASASLMHQATARLVLAADVSWTQWDRFDGIAVTYDNPAQPETVERLNYENAMRYAVGAEYAARPDLALRAGLAFDETPTNEAFRSPRVPDTDRTIAALGLSWSPREALTLDAGYQHLFFEESDIASTGSSGDTLRGDYESAADIVSLGATWRF